MSRKFASLFLSLTVVLTLLLSACQPQTVEVVKEVEVTKQVEVIKEVVKEVEKEVQVTVAAPAEPQPFITWFGYDQGYVDAKSDESVGNEYLRQTMPQFNEAFAGKWVWDNEFTPWDRA